MVPAGAFAGECPPTPTDPAEGRPRPEAGPMMGSGGIASRLSVRICDNARIFREDDVMTGPEVLDVARDALVTLVLVASPLMLVGLAIGVIISLLQALTQIQEMTLVFVPKILAIFAAMLIALPFMADLLQSHMLRIMSRIAAE
jgi:flagellar biosynthetic protein FliQ